MDKVWEQVLKHVPSEIVPAILAIGVAFFGVYYAKGLRSYADALHDRLFLSLSVLIAAAFVVLWIQKPEQVPVAKDARVVLLVPRFEGDDQRQIETLFTQQVQAALHLVHKDAAVAPVDAYVRDRDSAHLTAKAQSALAIVYQPKVLRTDGKDGRTWICFSLLTLQPEASKPYPPKPAEIDKETLNDIAGMLNGVLVTAGRPANDPVLVRLDALERQVAELAAAVFRTNALVRGPSKAPAYRTKRAVVIGVDRVAQGTVPDLLYAASDAVAFAHALGPLGFQTTLLTNEAATLPAVEKAIDEAARATAPDDLLLVYYAGNGVRSTDLYRPRAARSLVLPTFDFRLEDPTTTLNLSRLVERTRAGQAGHTLLILDACHGTFGLVGPGADGAIASNDKRPTFQIMAASQDDEYAFETEGGGAFTQALLKHMGRLLDSAGGASTNALSAAVTPDLAAASSGRQRPKLVTLAGAGDIVLGRDKASSAASSSGRP